LSTNTVQTISRETTNCGVALKVDDAHPHAQLKINDDYTVTFAITQEHALKSARLLYQEVRMVGVAAWDTQPQRVWDFTLGGIREFLAGDLQTAFREMAVVIGG
jgi:hypothetical protein